MKMKSLFVMGMVATTLVNSAEAQRRNTGNNGNPRNGGGFNNGPIRNQDLFQIRELQQTYTEYMRASTKLKQLYVDLNDVTTKLGRNQSKIDEFIEQRRGAKLAFNEKSTQASRIENRIQKSKNEKETIILNIVNLEAEIQSLEVDISAEKTRIAPFIKAKSNAQKRVDNYQSTFNEKQAAVSSASTSLSAAEQKKATAENQAKRVQRTLTSEQRKFQALENQVSSLESKLAPLAPHADKIETVNEHQAKIDDYNRKIKKYPWKRSDKRKWKRERDILEAKKKAIIRTLPANAVANYKQFSNQLKVVQNAYKRQQSMMERLNTSLAKFEATAAQAGTEFEVAKIEKDEAIKAFAPVKKKYEGLSAKLNTASKKLAKQSKDLNSFKASKRAKKGNLAAANNELNDVSRVISNKEQNLSEVEGQLAQISADIEVFKNNIQAKKARIKELEANKQAMEQTEVRLFQKLSNSYVRTHNNKVFNMFVGGLNAITPEMREKMQFAAATGAKIMLWGDLTNEDLMSRISPITGITGAAQLPISEIQGATPSTQNFSLNVRMQTFELNIDQQAVPVLMTADQRVIMAAKIDMDLGVVMTSALNPNDLNEFDMKALLEMIAYSDISEYQPVVNDDPSDGGDNGGGDLPGDGGSDDGGDFPGDGGSDDGGDYPGDGNGDEPGEPQVFGTVFKDTESRAIQSVVDGKETLTYKMDIDAEKGFVLSDVELNIEATHTYIGDIQIYLTSPSGKTVELRKNVGGRDQSLNDVYSKEIMQAFEGEMIRGLWVLTVKDYYKDRDVGSVNAVRFNIEGER